MASSLGAGFAAAEVVADSDGGSSAIAGVALPHAENIDSAASAAHAFRDSRRRFIEFFIAKSPFALPAEGNAFVRR